MQVDFFDRYSHGTSLLHRTDARRKLVLAIAFTFLVIATPQIVSLVFTEPFAVWLFLGAEAWIVLVLYAVSGLPWRYLGLRLLAVIWFLVLLAIGVPLSRGFNGGWNEGAQILGRSLITLTLMITTIATTPFGR